MLAWIGTVGHISDGRKQRPTAKMVGEGLEGELAGKDLAGQVWFVRREPGEDRDRITAGRSAVNDLIIPDWSVSMVHCELAVRVDREAKLRRVFVTDLESLNGTAVRGTRIEPHTEVQLRAGDELALGRLRFVLLPPDEFVVRVRILGSRKRKRK